MKKECIRPKTPITKADAERLVAEWVHMYNHDRLHSSIGYVTPVDMLHGKAAQTHAQRDEKLQEARLRRRRRSRSQKEAA